MRKHIAICALLVTSPLLAQQPTISQRGNNNAALEQKIRDLEDRIIALEGQVRILKSQSPAPGAAAH